MEADLAGKTISHGSAVLEDSSVLQDEESEPKSDMGAGGGIKPQGKVRGSCCASPC